MDKKKQVEEMAKIISCDCSIKTMRQCEGFDDCKACRATDLYNAGYRKIPEGAVVMTREEYEELDKCRWNNKKVTDILLRFEEVEARIRKETAEKFAERVKERAEEMATPSCYVYMVYVDDIDEICKEITEGKDE